jgi:hypothetical protein
MEDSFEKSIRQTMENPPDFPYDDGMWKKIEKELNNRDRPPKDGLVAWWWLLPATLLPALLAGWLLTERQQAQNRINALEQQLIGNQLEIDTIERQAVKIIYDTIIYHTTVLQPTEVRPEPVYIGARQQGNMRPSNNNNWSPSRTDFSPSLLSSSQNGSKYTSLDDPLAIGLLRNANKQPVVANQSKTAAIEQSEKNATKTTGLLPNPWPLISLETDLILPGVAPTELKKPRHPLGFYLSKLSPQSIAIAAGAGVFQGLHLPHSDGTNVVTSGELEFRYSKNWHLSLGIERLNLGFSLKEDMAQAFNSFPPPTPNHPEDELERLSSTFNYWQFPLSLKYRFLSNRRIQPYLAFGLIGLIPTTSLINYEFEEEGADGRYTITSENLLDKTLYLSDAFGLLGLQWQFSKKWYVWTEAEGQRRWQEGGIDFQQNQFVKVKAGLKYRL